MTTVSDTGETVSQAGAATGPSGPLHLLRSVAGRHPEWWVVLAAAAAWAWMAAPGEHAAHGGHVGHVGHAGHAANAGRMVPGWAAMVVAMMLPLTLPSVRHVALSSAPRRRHRAMAGFLAGYLAVWMVTMLGIAAAWSVLAERTGWVAAAAVAVAAAVLWEVAPAKRRQLRRCARREPLAPGGWRADRDCARQGATAGISCVGACWALMAACAAFAHSLPVMAVLFGVQLSGRYRRRPSAALAALAVAGAGLVSIALRIAGGHAA